MRMTMENQCPHCGEVYEGEFHMCRDEQERGRDEQERDEEFDIDNNSRED